MRRPQSLSALAAAVLFAAAALVAGAARADWLVLRDGTRLETKGPWQVKGRQVVFTRADGKLAALRLVDVDLDASATATAPPPVAELEPASAAPLVKKKPILVLTDRDVKHVDGDGQPLPEPGAAAAETPAKPPEPPPGAVLVESWDQKPTADGTGIEITGSLKNTGLHTATEITVVAKVFDATGALLGTADATLVSSALAPAGRTSFRASLLGILHFASARFEVQNRSVEPAPASSTAR